MGKSGGDEDGDAAGSLQTKSRRLTKEQVIAHGPCAYVVSTVAPIRRRPDVPPTEAVPFFGDGGERAPPAAEHQQDVLAAERPERPFELSWARTGSIVAHIQDWEDYHRRWGEKNQQVEREFSILLDLTEEEATRSYNQKMMKELALRSESTARTAHNLNLFFPSPNIFLFRLSSPLCRFTTFFCRLRYFPELISAIGRISGNLEANLLDPPLLTPEGILEL